MDGQIDPDAALLAAGAMTEIFMPSAPPRGKPFGRLRVLTLEDARAAPPRRYLLPGLIAPEEMSLWWGPPKCGKSFLMLRLAYGLARGVGLWGREPPRTCRVLYVAAEGEGGFASRLLALADVLGDAGESFRYIAQRTMVGPPHLDLADVVAAAKDMGAELIVLDTLARTFGEGDENAAQDMGRFVAAVDQIREETQAHVAVIHHGTKDGGTARGSGALLGAADLIVKVSRGKQEGDANSAHIEAAKDDVDGAALPFKLHKIDLPPATDGTQRRTCVAVESPADGEAAPRKSLGVVAETALRFLVDLMAKEAMPLPAGPDYPPGLHGVPMTKWRAECEARRLSVAEVPKDRGRVFRKASADLRNAGRIAMRDDWVWTTRDGQPGV